MNQKVVLGNKMLVACRKSIERNKEKYNSIKAQSRPICSY